MINEIVFVERGALEHMGKLILFFKKEDVKHMSLETFLLSMKLWNTRKDNLEVLGISPEAFHVDVEHNLWNIRTLAIVSLGVSYKYILALVLSK